MNTFRQRFMGNPRVIAGLAWLGLVVLVAAAAPLIASHHPFEIVAEPFLIPSLEHPFGTDSLGRSIWSALSTAHGPPWSSPPSPPSPSGPWSARSPAISVVW